MNQNVQLSSIKKSKQRELRPKSAVIVFFVPSSVLLTPTSQREKEVLMKSAQLIQDTFSGFLDSPQTLQKLLNLIGTFARAPFERQ